jgi:hypothetical protein
MASVITDWLQSTATVQDGQTEMPAVVAAILRMEIQEITMTVAIIVVGIR